MWTATENDPHCEVIIHWPNLMTTAFYRQKCSYLAMRCGNESIGKMTVDYLYNIQYINWHFIQQCIHYRVVQRQAVHTAGHQWVLLHMYLLEWQLSASLHMDLLQAPQRKIRSAMWHMLTTVLQLRLITHVKRRRCANLGLHANQTECGCLTPLIT